MGDFGLPDFDDELTGDGWDEEAYAEDVAPATVAVAVPAVPHATTLEELEAGKPVVGTLWQMNGEGGIVGLVANYAEGAGADIATIHKRHDAGRYTLKVQTATGAASIVFEVKRSLAEEQPEQRKTSHSPAIPVEHEEAIRRQIRGEERQSARRDFDRDRQRYEDDLEALRRRLKMAQGELDDTAARLRKRDEDVTRERERADAARVELAQVQANQGMAEMRARQEAMQRDSENQRKAYEREERLRNKLREVQSELERARMQLELEHPDSVGVFDRLLDKAAPLLESALPLLTQQRTPPESYTPGMADASTLASPAMQPPPSHDTVPVPVDTAAGFAQHLLHNALSYLSNHDITSSDFSAWLAREIERAHDAGVELDADGLRIIANTLVVRAAQASATPERVSSVLAPVLVAFVPKPLQFMLRRPVDDLLGALEGFGVEIPDDLMGYTTDVLTATQTRL